VTQSHCPSFSFFIIINLVFKILMYLSSADFCGWFLLKGKSRKTFEIIISTKWAFQISVLGGSGAAAGQQPPRLGAPLTHLQTHYCPGLVLQTCVVFKESWHCVLGFLQNGHQLLAVWAISSSTRHRNLCSYGILHWLTTHSDTDLIFLAAFPLVFVPLHHLQVSSYQS
jgi:hypothetical protein